ncbi:MAG: NAD(P)H-hydrate dehydratase [Armatimonas sp.]
MKVATAAQLRELDRRAIEEVGIPGVCLMQSAGEALARAVSGAHRVAILCGKGNNGGDGFVAARMLAGLGAEVSVFAENGSTGDAQVHKAALAGCGIDVQPLAAFSPETRFDVLLDCLLGTGAKGAPRGAIAEAITKLNTSETETVACDIPSGVNADTGEVAGEAVKAVRTVTFAAVKPGLLLYPGAEYAGQVTVADIGIPKTLLNSLESEVTTTDWVRAVLPPRTQSRDANKGAFGRLLILAGSDNMPGAAALSAMSALRAGCGLVYVAIDGPARAAFSALVPEAVLASRSEIPELLPRVNALAIGPGLGRAGETRALVESLLKETSLPAVVDADGLAGLVPHKNLVITPHPGEAAELLGKSTKDVQADREASVRALAEKYGAVALLKGARTLIAAEGKLFYNREGSVALATAGSGDVLTGVIGALLAGGLSPLEAARVAAWLHARAGELCLVGALARDIAGRIPEARSCVYTDRENQP